MNQTPTDLLAPLRAAVVTAVQQLLAASGAASVALPMGSGQMILAGETGDLARLLAYTEPTTAAQAAEIFALTGSARIWLGLNVAGRVVQYWTRQPAAAPRGLHLVEYVCAPAAAAPVSRAAAPAAQPVDQLNAAIQRAAAELPDGYVIRVEVECGAGWVEWIDPEIEHHIIDSEESSLADDVETAIESAIAAEAEARRAAIVLNDADLADSEGGHHD